MQNSLVFVSHTHGLWGNSDRKPSKRYGLLRKSPRSMLGEMMAEHKDEVFEWISEYADEPSDEEEEADQDSPMK